MESDQGKEYQSDDDDRQAREIDEARGSEEEVVPGVPVVRSNTPRPLSFNSMLAASGYTTGEQPEIPAVRPAFPGKAPSAPPLPEELEDAEKEGVASADVEVAALPDDEPQEFIWLFEYGPEMDSTLLNSEDRLDGAAFLYGPAVLKGYTLMFAQIARSNSRQVLATIIPSADSDAEAWGMLYRIPRHVTVRSGSQPSLLDTAHSAGAPNSLYRPISVVVREVYREREITCGTYTLTENARRQFPLLSVEQVDSSLALVQQLASLARKQKFPERYLKLPSPNVQQAYPLATPPEQNTEPLPALREKDILSLTSRRLTSIPSTRLLSFLALYLMLLLLLILAFAVLQGMGFAGHFLTSKLLILGVPWLVLFYGLLGACMSSLISLGRSLRVRRPFFVVLLWFARPFLGIVLAALAYLLFNSGLFVGVESATKHTTLLPLLGALAGLSEGWFFLRRPRPSG